MEIASFLIGHLLSPPRIEVESHCVKWHQKFKFPCKMYASANTAELEPCLCKVSVRKVSQLEEKIVCHSGMFLLIPQETESSGYSYQLRQVANSMKACS